ncbi:ATP-binding protein [Pedobacter glucosidilyticus]|uniref:ATP-binding protein n=1 Tax=Pedobacter glucosidilyticus TaxID=1122941 RepID=UPI0026F1204C|nr:ATP-binding protein [Pedobacter glucosidilyticus]
MLSSEEIKSIVKSVEGYNAEFKVSIPSKVREITSEICAFANAAGGILLLGVTDKNEIKGIDINNVQRSAMQNSLNEINPQLHFSFYFVDVDGCQIGVIEVSSGPQKPYIFSGAIYVRLGPNSQKLTGAEEMRRFFQQTDKIYFDETPCLGFNASEDIDTDFFAEFRKLANFSHGIDDIQIQKNLKLYHDVTYLKNGAVLFFGKLPENFFDKAVIRCIAFRGTNKTNITDDKLMTGPLYKQYLQAMNWLRNKLNISYKIEGSGPRKELWEIPETVFKETIINALSHRDYYDKGGRINIELFDDRIEISNPGGLVEAITKQEFGKRSHSRNPLIFGLFERIHMVEQIGSGISRIKDLMSEASLLPPEFSYEGFVRGYSVEICPKRKVG